MTQEPVKSHSKPTFKMIAQVEPLMAKLRCSSKNDFVGWLRFAPRMLGTSHGLEDLFCHDCLPEYRTFMEARGRCFRAPDWVDPVVEEEEGVQIPLEVTA